MAASTGSTQKAIKAIIHLGNIPLDVYQMPDGSFEEEFRSQNSGVRINQSGIQTRD